MSQNIVFLGFTVSITTPDSTNTHVYRLKLRVVPGLLRFPFHKVYDINGVTDATVRQQKQLQNINSLRPGTRTSSINSFCHSDAMQWHRSGSKLAKVMVCHLTVPSHYLNYCWLLIRSWHSSGSNFTASVQTTVVRNDFENYAFEMIVTSLRDHRVN